jgi:hypothetical protein
MQSSWQAGFSIKKILLNIYLACLTAKNDRLSVSPETAVGLERIWLLKENPFLPVCTEIL